MLPLQKGRYTARMAGQGPDLAAARALRRRAFLPPGGGQADDADDFDAVCQHILIEDGPTRTLVCCFRLMPLPDGSAIARSYSAQFYDLAALARYGRPMIEMGRFCLDPDWHDPDILRLAWAAVTRLVDATGTGMLFGCSSFPGIEEGPYADTFAMLKDRHLAPRRWLPRVKARHVVRYAKSLATRTPDIPRALRAMPPLLRTYLAMGGWVSDHAVVDRDLNTLHVFTGLEIAAIPPARARALRAVAQ
jgi:L-ornithine Nalpha-acyltransferase